MQLAQQQVPWQHQGPLLLWMLLLLLLLAVAWLSLLHAELVLQHLTQP
jgi:hypothetical protein